MKTYLYPIKTAFRWLQCSGSILEPRIKPYKLPDSISTPVDAQLKYIYSVLFNIINKCGSLEVFNKLTHKALYKLTRAYLGYYNPKQALGARNIKLFRHYNDIKLDNNTYLTRAVDINLHTLIPNCGGIIPLMGTKDDKITLYDFEPRSLNVPDYEHYHMFLLRTWFSKRENLFFEYLKGDFGFFILPKEFSKQIQVLIDQFNHDRLNKMPVYRKGRYCTDCPKLKICPQHQ